MQITRDTLTLCRVDCTEVLRADLEITLVEVCAIYLRKITLKIM